MNTSLHPALRDIRRCVDALHHSLRLDTGLDIHAFNTTLDAKVLTLLDPDYPLLAAIIGGGSAGKSSLFNALVGKKISPVQAKAGFSRRVLAAVNPQVLSRDDFLDSLFGPFGSRPEPVTDPRMTLEPGPPCYVCEPAVPPNLILLDTPDFDTGNAEDYQNRHIGKPVLEASDVFLYIFTNATYNNRDNTAFVRSILSKIGYRKCILIYRCSRGLTDAEAAEHAGIVAEHLYGQQASAWVTGIYRVHEDDQVAMQNTLMTLHPVSGSTELQDLLASMPPFDTRREALATTLAEVRRVAGQTVDHAVAARLHLEIYRDAVRIATSWAVANALQAFPQTELLQRFAHIWERGQPQALKLVKAAGKITAWPLKTLVRISRKIKNPARSQVKPSQSPLCAHVMEESLSVAANDLRRKLLASELTIATTNTDANGRAVLQTVDRLHDLRGHGRDKRIVKEQLNHQGNTYNLLVPRPSALCAFLDEHQSSMPWEETLQTLISQAMAVSGMTEEIDSQLESIAATFRKTMTWLQKVRELLTASLGPLPAIGAATYILMTGDMVAGAPTVYAKLSGLFGLHDLVATLAIPVAQGLNKMDQQNLEALLAKTFEAWFHSKRMQVEEVIQAHLTGSIIDAADTVLQSSEQPVHDLENALKAISREAT